MSSTREKSGGVQRGNRFWHCVLLLLCLFVASGTLLNGMLFFPRPVVHAQSADWTQFFGNDEHTGFNGAETIIAPSTVGNLKIYWSRHARHGITTQPVEAHGILYWGSWDGLEHATNPTSGQDLWTANLGQTSNCKHGTIGVLSTATVDDVQINGTTMAVVFVGGGNNDLYALNADTGAVIWQTQLGTPPQSFLYSSPTYYNGSIYIGVSGNDDCSKVQSQLVQIDASTGTVLSTFDVVPAGCTGGSVWTSPTINETTGMLYFSVGEKGNCPTTEPMAESLIEVAASNLALVGYWQVPLRQRILDGDFGASPTLFSATIGGTLYQMVGLANKNGLYYAFEQNAISAGPLWQVRLGTPPGPSSSSSAWDGTALYVAGSPAVINGTTCPGSLYALNPADGTKLWSHCLSFDPRGGVMAVPGLVEMGAGSSIIIVDTATGNQVFSFQDTHRKANFEGPGTIVNGMLFHGNLDGYLYAFGP
ncbi:MAG TPA: PQQ-binding-like beta-propeller repeat protein [Ktedonobacteraceae bacterium]|nr:PQQ-binding-like beta-propeller repeat protein [Ktedonobacteraceae bacterium]